MALNGHASGHRHIGSCTGSLVPYPFHGAGLTRYDGFPPLSPEAEMRRREFIRLIGGAAVWPLPAHAQRRLPTIGFLGPASASAMSAWTAAFVQRLHELGWIEGRTVAIEFRWADGRNERLPEIAAEFVRLKVDVIVTTGTPVPILKNATSIIPIVFTIADDPVASGLVTSLSRPGGNVTGLSQLAADLGGKRVEILREIVPGLRGWRP